MKTMADQVQSEGMQLYAIFIREDANVLVVLVDHGTNDCNANSIIYGSETITW